MPNPLEAIRDFVAADAPNLPAGTTRGTAVPSGSISAFHVQYAWDGTPTDADNREDTVVRVTVWGPRGRPIDTQNLAGQIRARLLAYSSPTVSRVDRGTGRLPGTDNTIQLPFCSFTVSLVMRALTTS